MRFALGALVALALAAVLGLGATWWTVANGLPVSGLTIGVWRAEPDAGTLGADPYEVAATARSGEAPLAYGDGLAFTALTDGGGRTLDASCDYELVGDLPPARLWTLAAFNSKGERFAKDAKDAKDLSLTSAGAVRMDDGPIRIALSSQARPGNWAPLEGEGRFVLRLSLYETTLGTPLERANPTGLLDVRRGACR
ncbi:DUF1214 domain-containing protein [Hansschlegelia zhihuaiae]|uniref:DUF1214 domain-containing protein n=1 Tax=Hansschlegelia zhihuaiae TaxID=405005 RepID=A0A4Q0MIX7_9HYPH|nr:DUF1214 domain-containing protein [Hansschlegelia zhihuaiae]RXF72896.1 DUF1214 domain-containing protein [Hansschlegelia zhihuaiae]